MKSLKSILLLIVLLVAVAASWHIYQQEQKKIAFKEDLVELSKIKYGLFNVDTWKEKLADILSKKVREFSLEGGNRKQMHDKIANFLYSVITTFEDRFHQENKKKLLGFMSDGIANLTGIFKQVKEDVPVFADQILDFLNEEQNRASIRDFLIQKLNDYADQTFAETDYTAVTAILNTYQSKDKAEAVAMLNTKLTSIEQALSLFKTGLLSLALCYFIFLLFPVNLSRLELMITLLFCFVFLLLGISLPMIEIDARISQMNFTLLGEQLRFADEVLYYKSKSILQVVGMMLSQGKVKVLFVGVLVFAFSVFFPMLKLVCSMLYLYLQKLRESKVVCFIVFKTGKWSMADVFVVAIFMAYIGFEGILSEQLKHLEGMSKEVELLTTNHSSLMYGFFVFTAFVLLSLMSASKIKVEGLMIND